jgi:arginase
MADVDKEGIEVIIQYALQHLCQKLPGRPIHVSIDVDALDDLEAPCTGTPGNFNKILSKLQ